MCTESSEGLVTKSNAEQLKDLGMFDLQKRQTQQSSNIRRAATQKRDKITSLSLRGQDQKQ